MGNRAESPLFIISDSRLRQQEMVEFATSMTSSFGLVSIKDAEKQIAEWYFRRHVPIPLLTELTGLYIRPFWRDGNVTPSLKPTLPRGYYSHHY